MIKERVYQAAENTGSVFFMVKMIARLLVRPKEMESPIENRHTVDKETTYREYRGER